MNKRDGLYCDPTAIAPLKPSELPVELRDLAMEIVAAARLSGPLYPMTTQAIANFLHPANSCYSIPIEGHNTHPLAIAHALRAENTMKLGLLSWGH